MASVKYVPSSNRHVYDEIMNGAGVQSDLLARADKVAASVMAAGLDCTTDVQAGKHRAHARVKVPYQQVTSFRAKGHNRRVDKVLQAALDAARG